MTIVREDIDITSGYTRIPNAWILDPTLSPEAISVLIHVLRHRTGWTVYNRSLRDELNIGEHRLRKALSLLEKAGYLVKDTARGVAGRFAGSGYRLADPHAPTQTPQPPVEKPLAQSVEQPRSVDGDAVHGGGDSSNVRDWGPKKTNHLKKTNEEKTAATPHAPAAQSVSLRISKPQKVPSVRAAAVRVVANTRVRNVHGAGSIISWACSEYQMSADDVASELIALHESGYPVTKNALVTRFSSDTPAETGPVEVPDEETFFRQIGRNVAIREIRDRNPHLAMGCALLLGLNEYREVKVSAITADLWQESVRTYAGGPLATEREVYAAIETARTQGNALTYEGIGTTLRKMRAAARAQ